MAAKKPIKSFHGTGEGDQADGRKKCGHDNFHCRAVAEQGPVGHDDGNNVEAFGDFPGGKPGFHG